MNRALLWLLLGLLLAVGAMVALVPGALRTPDGVGSMALIVAAAGVPGLVVLLVLAARRRDAGAEEDDADRVVHPIATSPEWEARHGGGSPGARGDDEEER